MVDVITPDTTLVLPVLVIDDAERWRQKAKESMTTLQIQPEVRSRYLGGVQFYEAGTPGEGLEKVIEHAPIAIILDINFNPQDEKNRAGLTDFLVPLRERGDTTPVIAWSQNTSRSLRWTARSMGANDFLDKNDSYLSVEIAYAVLANLGIYHVRG